MSVQSDFLRLINELWEVEQINMWNPKAHLALAYLLDQTYGNDDYESNYAQWMQLIRDRDFNEFSWAISLACVNASKTDARIDTREIEEMEGVLLWEKSDYDQQRLARFGVVDEDYAPDWFWEMFGSYIKLEELKRETAVKAYFMKECAMSEKRAQDSYLKLYKHFDLFNEFYYFIKNDRFISYNPAIAEGFTAQQLHEATYLTPLGAYNYMIYLRESPKEALEDLKKGLPKR